MSLSEIVTVEVDIPSATTGPVPDMSEFAATAAPAVKLTVPPTLETGVSIESVFISALSELRVHVEAPVPSETEHEP